MKKLLCVLCVALLLLGVASAAGMQRGMDVYAYFSGDANVRTGPGLDYDSIGVAMKGSTRAFLEAAAVDDRGVAWYKVADGTGVGWVSSRYAQLGSPSVMGLSFSSAPLSALLFGDGELRSLPSSMEGEVLCSVYAADGGSLQFLGYSYEWMGSAWYYVDYQSLRGWLPDTCVELQYR